MTDDVDVAAIEARLRKLPPTSRAAKLRPLFPLIDQRIREGVPAKVIVEELVDAGISITVRGLHDDLFRWRKRQRKLGTKKSDLQNGRKNAAKQIDTPATVLPHKVPPPEPTTVPLRTKGDLRRLRDEPVNLEQFARVGKTLKE